MAADAHGTHYSDRLGSLTDAQLQRALDRFDLGKLERAEPATTGLFGQNVFITTTKGEYVLRGAPHPPWQFDHERYVTKLIHERTDVPGPWPFRIEESSDDLGWPYAVMPRMPGLDVGNPAVRDGLSEDECLALARAMGETLAQLHQPAMPHCGEFSPDTGDIPPTVLSPADWTLKRARWWLDLCREASAATTDADVAWVGEVLQAGRPALEEPFKPAIVHHDYKENNVVAERTTDGWRVTGLFDVGGAFFGDGEEDLSRSVAAYAREDIELARSFVAGYRAGREFRPGDKERSRVYMLIDRLIIWEYGQRNSVWFEPDTKLREYAEPIMNLEPW
jgi:hygromycin-B 7''-O-kinase